MATENLYPAIRPSLDLNFAGSKALDPRITFSRASAATCYDGKTVAKAEENLLTYSQDFDNAAWLKSSCAVTSNAVTAPDGTNTADQVTASSGTNLVHTVYAALSASLNGPYVASFYAKAGTNSFVQYNNNSSSGNYANFDLTSGQVGTSGSNVTSSQIVAVGGGWYRCTVYIASSSSQHFYISLVTSASSEYRPTVTTSGTESIYIWGAQLEQRSQVTDYTPTTTQPITNYIPVLQTAPAGVPRFDHNPVTGESLGLLVEEQRTNLLYYSEEFDNGASWGKSNVTVESNVAVAPNGNVSADKLSFLNLDSFGFIYNGGQTGSVTGSVYVKYGSQRYIQLLSTGESSYWANFDLKSGVSYAGGNAIATITNVGNGWYRCSMNMNAAYSYQLTIGIVPSLTSARAAASNLAGYVYTWGAQLEVGSFPTSYIKTEASQVTRAADSAQMTGANFSSWYRQDEGTTVSEFVSSTIGIFHVHSNISGYGLDVGISAGDDAFQYNNSTNLVTSGNKYVRGSTGKIGFAGSLTSRSIALNGGSVAASQTPMIMNNTQQGLRLGATASGSLCINGCLKRITYYPKRLTDAQLQALTA